MAERLASYYEPQREGEFTGRVPDLAYDVAAIRQDAALEEAHLLPGTGFLVKDQIRLFYENVQNGGSFQDAMNQIEQDVQGFKVEYLVQQPVFPIVLDRAMCNGEERLVGPLYGGKPIAEATSGVEREGAVRQAVEEIEEKLLAAEAGTVIVMTSPRGESGYQNKNGVLEESNEEEIERGVADRIVYPDSQTYCYEVRDDGSVRGFTLKSDMDIFQNEELLRRLGVDPERFKKYPRSMDRIKQSVLNYAVLPPVDGKTIEDVLDTITDIKDSETLFTDIDGNRKTADDARELLHNPDSLWTLDDTTQALLERFRKYAWWGLVNKTVDQRDLEVALGDTVLRLMHEIHGRDEMSSSYGGEQIADRYDANEVLMEMQQIPGCAGGGVVDSVTPRESKTENKKILCCTCPFCNKEVEAEIEGGRITCPNCKKTAKWSD